MTLLCDCCPNEFCVGSFCPRYESEVVDDIERKSMAMEIPLPMSEYQEQVMREYYSDRGCSHGCE